MKNIDNASSRIKQLEIGFIRFRFLIITSEYYMNRMMASCYLGQGTVISHRTTWLEFEPKITELRRSKRFVQYSGVLSRCLSWDERNICTTISEIIQ